MTGLYILLALVVMALVAAISIYNRLVRNRQMVQEGWSGIDVQLKRRADLIPNLIEAVKGYMGHEKGVLEKVTELRAQSLQAASVGDKAKAEGALGAALANLFAVAENYPDLKASQNFIQLQQSLADIEEQIQLSRRYYNGAVRNLNILVASFPSNIIANMFQFAPAEYFEIEDAADRAVPKVAFG
ncbi:MAG: LemA family protein [Syntrophales bacterium]|nr:LemA family protein [Syntrophales bacterium]MDD5642939.1 LemA family protein [Syntrophales bacterium]